MNVPPPFCTTRTRIRQHAHTRRVRATHHAIRDQDRLEHALVVRLQRLSVQVAEHVGHDRRGVPAVLRDLLHLLPVEDVARGEDPGDARELQCRVDFDLAGGAEDAVAQGRDKGGVRASTAGGHLEQRWGK